MKNLPLIATLTLCLLLAAQLSAQQTVGLFLNTPESFDGYTLFSPIASTTTYLINNCGEKVHSWPSTHTPGQAVYLLENGTLLRTGKLTNNTFNAGGQGGIIEMFDWNGNLIWSYTISSSTLCQHHDLEFLPNGHILAVVWEAHTAAEATQAGRTSSGATLWSEKIVEIVPDLVNGGGTEVWEWRVWDHLVQDENPSADNFGVVSRSPGLVNLNYYTGNATASDWLHINAVDYNPTLDQLVVSVHNFSEIWIIDHSTTLAEAASHTGGNAGKGGDLLYRWGNLQAFDQGTAADRKLYLQHNANWIDDSTGIIMVFNNQAGTGDGANYSTVNVIETPVDASGAYPLVDSTYGPEGFEWTYKASVPTAFYSANISGAQRLPNGNTLICAGTSGHFFEVDSLGTMVWDYVNPVKNGGIIAQGSPSGMNLVFRAERYARDFPGFAGQTLTPQGYIETGSAFTCNLYVTGIEETAPVADISLYPNPATEAFSVSYAGAAFEVKVMDLMGRTLFTGRFLSEGTIEVQSWKNGMYVVEVRNANHQVVKTSRLVVLH